MSTLRLAAYCRYFDKTKVYFTAIDEESEEKLTRHGIKSDFAVNIRRPESCAEMVGVNCSILIQLRKTSFISQYSHNFGERIEIIRLNLIEIDPVEK